MISEDLVRKKDEKGGKNGRFLAQVFPKFMVMRTAIPLEEPIAE